MNTISLLSLSDSLLYIESPYSLPSSIVPEDGHLTAEQVSILRDALAKSKEKLQRLTADHRDMHGTVSKVGKAIDRNFVCDLSSTARTDVLVHERNVQLLNKVIAQHFYRQGMDDVAESIIEVRKEDL